MGRYNRSFKQEAVKLVTETGLAPAEAARKLGLPESTLSYWLAQAGWQRPEQRLSDDAAVLQIQLRDAQAKLKDLELENQILKKAAAYLGRQHL